MTWAEKKTKAGFYFNTELLDDSSPYGGIAHRGETLKEFLEETYDSDDIENLDMEEVNTMLKACGIRQIPYALAFASDFIERS